MGIKEALRQPYQVVFLDGRNEHGSHVLLMPGDSLTEHDEVEQTLNDQSLGIAERIISEAERMGHQVNHCVVTIWNRTDDFPDERGYWEYQNIDDQLTELMCGTPAEQEKVLADGAYYVDLK